MKTVVPDILANGQYTGRWGAYVVEFLVNVEKYKATTVQGIRGWNIPCIVTVSDDTIHVETAK